MCRDHLLNCSNDRLQRQLLNLVKGTIDSEDTRKRVNKGSLDRAELNTNLVVQSKSMRTLFEYCCILSYS